MADIDEYVSLLALQRDGILKAVEGLSTEALDWQPLAADTSSIGILAAHSCGVIGQWFIQALTGKDIGRDRAAEFATRQRDAAALTALVNETFAEATAALEALPAGALAQEAPIAFNPFKDRVGTPKLGITYALQHVGEHIGHMQLTRQMWEARGG